jgi:NAD(P)-dependent dehydrogenase (short-subunit alcohol dehydrogenase family)
MSSPSPPNAVVLVTGSARRIGRDIALQLARGGRAVAVHYRRSRTEAEQTAAQCRSLGVHAQPFEADLSDEAACRALVPAVIEHFGRLDAVVNNASTFEYDDAASFSHACMDHHWRANTAPAVILAQALHEHLLGRDGSGCVVNLLDQKLWNLNPDHFSYTRSKAALETATTLLALALAPKLRVCGVAPGVTLVSGPMSEAQLAQAQQLTPLRHSSSAADIAQAVSFLLDAPAITGTTLIVDGGQHLTAQRRDVLYLTPKS